MHQVSAPGHNVDEEGNASKFLCIESYNKNTGFVDMNVMMVIPYRISQKTWEWTNKLFFCLIDLSTLNAFKFIDRVGINSA
jgi:hypothetical protein